MLEPESDWTGRTVDGALDFAIERQIRVAGISVDIRRFRWVQTKIGDMSPARHVLDYSIGSRPRSSTMSCDYWRGEKPSGEMLYMPPGAIYRGQPAPERRHMLCVAFSQSLLDEIFAEEGAAPDMYAAADMRSDALRRHLARLVSELWNPGFGAAALVQGVVTEAVVELVRHLGMARKRPEKVPRSGIRQIRKAADFIHDNLDCDLGLSSLARECGVSTRHLTRLFKAEMGMTVSEFVAARRIAMAKDLLRDDSCAIKEISWRCGFQTPSAFGAAFRAATGMTPGEYRGG